MKITRSSKCSLKFTTAEKRGRLQRVLGEYGKVVNAFIDLFWDRDKCPENRDLLKDLLAEVPDTWLSERLKKVAAREAISMIKARRSRDGEKAVKPTHSGRSMTVSSTIADLRKAKKASSFDAWLHVASVGGKIVLDLPIRFHKHFNKWAALGKRLNAYVIHLDRVQFCFEIETGPKLTPNRCVGVDTGIKALASLSTGEQLGGDIEDNIHRVVRCKSGSKGQKRAIEALKQRIDEIAKETTQRASLVVVENLKGITFKTKADRRLAKNMRRVVGKWNVRYWLNRLQQKCEENRVSFRSVSSRYTSITCSACGHADKGNRSLTEFRCLKCGHTDNADINAARNILDRFLTGPYGAGCKPLPEVVR
jgi:IS605 OrfB family transposase